MALELLLQRELRAFALGEQHQPRRIAIDPVHDERAPPAAPAQIDLEILEHRARVVAALQRQRHRQQPGRLVQHDQRLVLVDDRQIAARRRASSGASRCRADRSTAGRRRRRATRAGGVGQRHLAIVDEHLAALERSGGLRPRTGALGRGQIFVEAQPDVAARRPSIQAHRMIRVYNSAMPLSHPNRRCSFATTRSASSNRTAGDAAR